MWESEIHRKFQQSYFHNSVPVIVETNKELEIQGLEWPPYKFKLFHGSFEKFLEFKEVSDRKIVECARNYLTGGGY
jgi:hypothetical protein